MATTVKVVRDFGIDGRLVHKHGESGWHPAHRTHKGNGETRFYDENSHEAHDAKTPTNAKEVLTNPELRQAYTKCLEGVEQPEFAEVWEAKKAEMKLKREAKAASNVTTETAEKVLVTNGASQQT
jgi:hypothetical protein